MENKDSIDMWINTCGSIRKTMKLAVEHNDIETVIELLNKFKEATGQLETMMRIVNKQKFTA
mgnify:FL=1|tara:strand:+ start:154 stop:339 length:186 start_codon:yes stop_codon:yes gene_type:complete